MTKSQLTGAESGIYFQSPAAICERQKFMAGLEQQESTVKIPSPQARERLRLYARLQYIERQRERKLEAAKRAMRICHKLKPSEFKAKQFARVFSNWNKLRAAV